MGLSNVNTNSQLSRSCFPSSEEITSMDHLPNEVLVKIFKHLLHLEFTKSSPSRQNLLETMTRLQLVCKNWKNVSQGQIIQGYKKSLQTRLFIEKITVFFIGLFKEHLQEGRLEKISALPNDYYRISKKKFLPDQVRIDQITSIIKYDLSELLKEIPEQAFIVLPKKIKELKNSSRDLFFPKAFLKKYIYVTISQVFKNKAKAELACSDPNIKVVDRYLEISFSHALLNRDFVQCFKLLPHINSEQVRKNWIDKLSQVLSLYTDSKSVQTDCEKILSDLFKKDIKKKITPEIKFQVLFSTAHYLTNKSYLKKACSLIEMIETEEDKNKFLYKSIINLSLKTLELDKVLSLLEEITDETLKENALYRCYIIQVCLGRWKNVETIEKMDQLNKEHNLISQMIQKKDPLATLIIRDEMNRIAQTEGVSLSLAPPS